MSKQKNITRQGIPLDAEAYFNNPENFTPSQWKRIQLRKALVEGTVDESALDIIKEEKGIGKIKTPKPQKGKFRGARKNWLSMR